MRDALSILDQAIASSSGRLTADSVRNLVGAAPAHILEEVMKAVSESKSDEVLRQVDHLIGEGHSPTHFARQLVRFLRNATVAKVAGKDSSLLQISSEERERVARVADLFAEEDLTRHLQIMLRTHGELAYKQEQRFHLELGLLKMAHAQKLLPLEQLLSDVAGAPAKSATTSTQRPQPKPSIVSGAASAETRRAEPPAARSNYVSPFAADSARKGTPRQEDLGPTVAPPGPRIVAAASQPEPVILGSAAPAPQPEPHLIPDSKEVRRPTPAASDQIEKLQAAVLDALSSNGQDFLVAMLSDGEWRIEGAEVVVNVAESQSVLDIALSKEARRLAIASASGVLGRAVQLRVVANAQSDPSQPKSSPAPRATSGTSGRARAEQDPVVRRMQEKFGAEIRTVVDHREKR
jgi:DNA polymerase-3 subunit gamma/tau